MSRVSKTGNLVGGYFQGRINYLRGIWLKYQYFSWSNIVYYSLCGARFEVPGSIIVLRWQEGWQNSHDSGDLDFNEILYAFWGVLLACQD